jgi:hypothetical protein
VSLAGEEACLAVSLTGRFMPIHLLGYIEKLGAMEVIARLAGSETSDVEWLVSHGPEVARGG